jgi:hypothetical protein
MKQWVRVRKLDTPPYTQEIVWAESDHKPAQLDHSNWQEIKNSVVILHLANGQIIRNGVLLTENRYTDMPGGC